MRQLIFTLILICWYDNSYSDTLHVFLNTSACRSCNLVGKQLERYETINKILYLTSNDYRIKEDILESYGFLSHSYLIKEVNDDYFKQNTLTPKSSYCVLQRGGNFLEFILGDQSILDSIYNRTTTHRALDLSAKLRVSDGVDIFCKEDNIIFQDYKLNRVHLTKVDGDSVRLSETIDATKFQVEDFFDCGCIDQKMYRAVLPIIQQMNLGKPEFESCHIEDQSINILIGFHIPTLNVNRTDTVITKKLFVYSRDLQSSKASLICIQNDGIDSTDPILGSRYSVLNSPFIKQDDTLYLPIVVADTLRKSLFVKQVVVNGILLSSAITEDLTYLLPASFKFKLSDKGNMVLLSRAMNAWNYFFVKTPLIYNIHSKRTYFIKNETLSKHLKPLLASINDVFLKDNTAYLLLKTNQRWLLEVYDLGTNNLLKSTPLQIDQEVRHARFFNGFEELLIYSMKDHQLYLKQIPTK